MPKREKGGVSYTIHKASYKNYTCMHTYLVKAVVDGELVVVQQDLLLSGEEPLAQSEAGTGNGRCVVLHVQLMRELVRSQFPH